MVEDEVRCLRGFKGSLQDDKRRYLEIKSLLCPIDRPQKFTSGDNSCYGQVP